MADKNCWNCRRCSKGDDNKSCLKDSTYYYCSLDGQYLGRSKEFVSNKSCFYHSGKSDVLVSNLFGW